jgi:UDP-glucose 4-epimerase
VSVVVTGGAGFIGANLCRRLTADGHTVTVLDDLSSGSRANLDGLDVQLVEGSILDRDALDVALRDATAIVHLAARTSVPRSVDEPVATHTVNATGTLEVLEAARRAGSVPEPRAGSVPELRTGGPHVIVASSASVYGANPTLPRREDLAPLPMSPYAASKLATEAYALAYQHAYGLPVLAFRFFNVFGPLQSAAHAYAAVVPMFLAAAIDGRPLVVHGDGLQTRDFTFVDSVTGLIADALARRVVATEPVNIAFGTRTSILTLARMVEDIAAIPLTIEHVAPRVGDVRDSEGDATRLRELFPDLTPVDLRDALRTTFEWFRAERGAAPRSGNAG